MQSLTAVVVLLATCQAVCGQFAPYIKVHNNLVSSVVRAENELLTPFVPYGRKLSQDPLQGLVVKGNAEGSIFYAPGNIFSSVPVFNPTVLAQAVFGGLPTGLPMFGRKLTQAGLPDPYNLIPKANVVASILSGNILPGYGRKLAEGEAPKADQWDLDAIHEALTGPNRKLMQGGTGDVAAANYLGSVLVGGVNIANELHAGRKLLDYRIGYGFPQGTGSKTIQDNAAASILANPALANNPVVDRQLFLGFQADEPHKRHLKEDDAAVNPVHAALGWTAPKN